MRSSDLRPDLARRRRRLALLMGAAALLGLGGSVPARAQDAPAPTGKSGEELFGTYDLTARGLGVQGSYEVVGLIPGGAPVMDLTLPETLARFSSGPSGYGLASLAYPGGVVANFGSLVTQSGGPGDQVPPYPIKAEAFFPSGPTEADSSQPGGIAQKVVTDARGAQSNASFPAIDAPPVIGIGSLSSASRSAIEGDLAISRSRVVLGNVRILGGLITIDSLVTDLVAAHNGQTGSTAGGTTASGVKFLGLDATLTEDGLILKKAPPVDGPAAPLAVLGDAAGPLSGLTGPVQQQLTQVLDQAVPSVNDVLARAGIHLAMLDPHDAQVDSGAATRNTTGLSLTMSYKGREQQALVDLVNSIPAELKPNVGPIPNPVTFLAENHIMGLALAPASVSALATPPFPAIDFALPDLPTDAVADVPAWSTTIDSPGFSTTPARLPAAPASESSSPATEPISSAAAGAVPAILVALALLASPLFGMGSARLADNVLAPVSTSCPTGLDKPPAPPRPL
jgi:hypothetical protein